MAKFEVPDTDLKNLLLFLGRAQISGSEAPAMVRLAQIFSRPLPELPLGKTGGEKKKE
jgi:hypothetical protein